MKQENEDGQIEVIRPHNSQETLDMKVIEKPRVHKKNYEISINNIQCLVKCEIEK